MPGAEVVWEAAVMQSEMTYIGKQQATLVQWVALRPIFEVLPGKTGYEGGGCRREEWWRQWAAYKQLWVTLEETSREERSRRRRFIIFLGGVYL